MLLNSSCFCGSTQVVFLFQICKNTSNVSNRRVLHITANNAIAYFHITFTINSKKFLIYSQPKAH